MTFHALIVAGRFSARVFRLMVLSCAFQRVGLSRNGLQSFGFELSACRT